MEIATGWKPALNFKCFLKFSTGHTLRRTPVPWGQWLWALAPVWVCCLPALQSSPWAALLIIWSCPVFSPKGCFWGSKTHDKSDLICVSCFHMTQFYPDNVYNLWGPENGREFYVFCPWTTRLSCSFSTIGHHSQSLSWNLSESTLRSHSQY